MEQFEQAKARMSKLKNDPGNEVKLKIYALFKQVCSFSACSSVFQLTVVRCKAAVCSVEVSTVVKNTGLHPR